MSRAAVLALTFAIAFIVLFLAPPFLPYRFDPYPLINWADVVDLLTPLILIPLYWLLALQVGMPRSVPWVVTFLALAAAWVEGHGIHLAANAIGHLLKNQPGPALDLTEFWDERFGHILWHSAALGLSALVLVAGIRADLPPVAGRSMAVVAGLVYGFALFLIGDEGGTAVLMIVFGVAFVFATLAAWRRAFASPILTMFTTGYGAVVLLFAAWFVYWGGRLPQFSELGWIK